MKAKRRPSNRSAIFDHDKDDDNKDEDKQEDRWCWNWIINCENAGLNVIEGKDAERWRSFNDKRIRRATWRISNGFRSSSKCCCCYQKQTNNYSKNNK